MALKTISTITAKIQIYASGEQSESLRITTNANRKACNWLSKHVFETRNLNQSRLNNLHYSDLRNEFGLKSQMAQSVTFLYLGLSINSVKCLGIKLN